MTTPGTVMPVQPARAAGIAVILILGSLTAFGPLSIDMYLPAFPMIESDLHTSASMVQLSLTACLIGLALGQLAAGPLSDQKGRKIPLMIGLAVYIVASLMCAYVPSIEALIICRFVQGVSGAAGIVIARAISRDMFSGVALTRFSATLMLVNGTAPILAPIFGGQLLKFMSWHGVFVVLAGFGAVMLVVVHYLLEETLPRDSRVSGGLRKTAADIGMLLKDRQYVGYALAQGFVMASLFAYISGSPFVLQNYYGVSPQLFSVLFAVNAIGFVIFGQFAGRLAGRIPERRLFATGILFAVTGGTAVLTSVLLGGGMTLVMVAIFIAVASVGLVATTGFSLAMQRYGHAAGSAAALLGVLSFIFGGLVAPLVGIAGNNTAIPMGLAMAAASWCAGLCYVTLTRPNRSDSAQSDSSEMR